MAEETIVTLKQAYFNYKLLKDSKSKESLSFILNEFKNKHQLSLFKQTELFYSIIKNLITDYNLKYVKLNYSKFPLLLNIYLTIKKLTKTNKYHHALELKIISDEMMLTASDSNRWYSPPSSGLIYYGTTSNLNYIDIAKHTIYSIIDKDKFMLIRNRSSDLVIGSVVYDTSTLVNYI